MNRVGASLQIDALATTRSQGERPAQICLSEPTAVQCHRIPVLPSTGIVWDRSKTGIKPSDRRGVNHRFRALTTISVAQPSVGISDSALLAHFINLDRHVPRLSLGCIFIDQHTYYWGTA